LQAIVGPSSIVAPSFGTFRSSNEVPNIRDIGLARREPMMGISNALSERLGKLNLDDGRSLADSADRLAIVWVSLATYITMELEEERHRALGHIVKRGLLLLRHPDCTGKLRDTIMLYLQGAAVSSPSLSPRVLFSILELTLLPHTSATSFAPPTLTASSPP